MDVGHPCVLINQHIWPHELGEHWIWVLLGDENGLEHISFRRNCILNSDEKKCLTIDQPGSGWSIFIHFSILKCVLIQYFCSLKTPVAWHRMIIFAKHLVFVQPLKNVLQDEAKPKLSGRHGENRRQGTCCLSEWTCSRFSFPTFHGPVPERSERHLLKV